MHVSECMHLQAQLLSDMSTRVLCHKLCLWAHSAASFLLRLVKQTQLAGMLYHEVTHDCGVKAAIPKLLVLKRALWLQRYWCSQFVVMISDMLLTTISATSWMQATSMYAVHAADYVQVALAPQYAWGHGHVSCSCCARCNAKVLNRTSACWT